MRQKLFCLLLSILLITFSAVAQNDDELGSSGFIIQLSVDESRFTGQYIPEDLVATSDIISNRLNDYGLMDVRVQIIGNSRILIESPSLPPSGDIDEIIELITHTALLEFVDFRSLNNQSERFVGEYILSTTQIEQGFLFGDNSLVNPITGMPFETVITGNDLNAAVAEHDLQTDTWIIAFQLSQEGSQIFGDYTSANIGQPMAIVLDGEVLIVPVIQAELYSRGIISGNFSEQEARQLAFQLRSGALPLPLQVDDVREFSTPLQSETIRIGTYNVGDIAITDVINAIRRSGTTIILLQEVSSARSEVLADELNMHVSFYQTEDSDIGLAVLSEFEIAFGDGEPLGIGDGIIQRVQFILDETQIITIYNLWLGALGTDESVLEEQLDLALAIINEQTDGRLGQAVIGGSFQANPDSTVIQMMQLTGLSDPFVGRTPQDAATWIDGNSLQRVDYLWVTSNLTLLGVGVISNDTYRRQMAVIEIMVGD